MEGTDTNGGVQCDIEYIARGILGNCVKNVKNINKEEVNRELILCKVTQGKTCKMALAPLEV